MVVVNTVDPSAESEATNFQETTADHIIKELEPREGIAAQISLANSLEQQIKADANEVECNTALSEDLRRQLENQREFGCAARDVRARSIGQTEAGRRLKRNRGSDHIVPSTG